MKRSKGKSSQGFFSGIDIGRIDSGLAQLS